MPFCPKCKCEYREGFTVCSDCGQKLVEKLHEEKEPELESVEMVEVASFTFEIQAQEAKMLLESHGIQSYFRNAIMSQIDLIISNADGGVKVFVRQEDAARARDILERA